MDSVSCWTGWFGFFLFCFFFVCLFCFCFVFYVGLAGVVFVCCCLICCWAGWCNVWGRLVQCLYVAVWSSVGLAGVMSGASWCCVWGRLV